MTDHPRWCSRPDCRREAQPGDTLCSRHRAGRTRSTAAIRPMHIPSTATALTADEQATLLDIVRQYHDGTATPQNAMAWVYGLVANSALNDGSL